MKRRPEKQHFLALSELAGAGISDSRGETVGEVADIFLDTGEARLAYVRIRLRSGGTDAAQGVVVPWSAISIVPGLAPDTAPRGRPVLRVAVRSSTLRKLAASDGKRA